MIGWDNGGNELHNIVSDAYLKILAATASVVFGLAMLYGAWSFGFTKDIGSSAGTYDILYRPVLSSETTHFFIKYIQDKLAMPVSADGVILGVILIVVQLGVTLYLSTVGPMCPSKQEIGDFAAVMSWYRKDIDSSKLNRVKLGLYLFLIFVIIIDNMSDTFFTVRLSPDASLASTISLFATMFVVAFFVNYVTSEMFVTLGCKLLFWGIGVSIALWFGKGARPPRRKKRAPHVNSATPARETSTNGARQQQSIRSRPDNYASRNIPVRSSGGEETELNFDFP